MNLPVFRAYMVLGKFLAAWVFIALRCCLTSRHHHGQLPGSADNGAIFTGYLGRLGWLAGGYSGDRS